tara:strand:+ start:343 stop:549 length:207 start_codon:yes stop_codon:yes gene_type:complete
MTEEEKLAFYQSEINGSPLVNFIGFRCTNKLATWLKTQGMIEARDYSAIIRRLIISAAEREGFDRNAP